MSEGGGTLQVQLVAQQEIDKFIHESATFLRWVKQLEASWPKPLLKAVVQDAGGPQNVAIICVDLLLCFTKVGRLASERIASIVEHVRNLFVLAHSLGVHNFILPQEDHPPNSLQFRAYGPHCISGSEEAQTVPELRELPFAGEYTVIPKRSINPGIGTQFAVWVNEHPNITRFIVTGDCTDLCVYHIATYLRFRANQFDLGYEVIVPADCVETYDMPTDRAAELGVLPHDAELMQLLFLYHMALNDIKVVKTLGG